jgi:hypothetical protein
MESILLAFLISKIKRYEIKKIFKIWQIYPVFLCVLIYIGLQLTVFLGDYSFIKYSKIFETIYILSYIFLILKFRLYYSAIIGSIFIFIGSFLNKIVISANNGKMPVFPKLSYITGYINDKSFLNANDVHALGNEATKFKFLSDIIDIGYSVMSIGDICIRLFGVIIIYNSIKYINEEEINIFYDIKQKRES